MHTPLWMKRRQDAVAAAPRWAGRRVAAVPITNPREALGANTPEQLAEFEAFAARMLVPDETVTAWIDVSAQLDRRWEAFRAHVTQISDQKINDRIPSTPSWLA